MERRTRGRKPGHEAVVILSAYPRGGVARRAALALVRDRILACATVSAPARAVYVWKGREVSERSTLLWGKTTAARAEEAVRAIRESHPDQVPEILVLPVVTGEPRYLEWLAGEVGPKRQPRRGGRRP